MVADFSEQISFGINHARCYWPWTFHQWPEDAIQTAIMGALSAEESTVPAVRREVNKAMYALVCSLGLPSQYDGLIERRSAKAAKTFKARHLRAIGHNSIEIAHAVGWSESTAARNAPLHNPELARQRRAMGGKQGGMIGATRRWGEYGPRHEKARTMRAAGATLEEIRIACGYRSLSAAHYAAKGLKKCIN